MQHVRNCGPQLFIISRKGGTLLAINDFIYRSNLKRFGPMCDKVYWECIHNRSKKCRSRLKTIGDDLYVTNDIHNHSGDGQRIELARRSDTTKDVPRDLSIIRGSAKRGRPRKHHLIKRTYQKSCNSIMEAVSNHPGQPILYASTTKGTMKLVVDGHHFRYTYRKGKYSIFQCCYKENKEECFVRVVTDQKLVYPLDGEHTHFVKARDKSVTSVKFTPGKIQESQLLTDERTQPDQHDATDNIEDLMPRPIQTYIKVENSPQQESLDFITELITETSAVDNNPKEELISSEEFRDKIKKRLEKALLAKKKQ